MTSPRLVMGTNSQVQSFRRLVTWRRVEVLCGGGAGYHSDYEAIITAWDRYFAQAGMFIDEDAVRDAVEMVAANLHHNAWPPTAPATTISVITPKEASPS